MHFTAVSSTAARLRNLAALVIMAALLCLPFADLEISLTDPGQELARMARGLLQPDFGALESPLQALACTLSFALLGVAGAIVIGFPLALLFHLRLVRLGCAFIRAIHELFWALIFMQVFGLSALTGLLAILLPYGCTFAKVYAEILQLADPTPARNLPARTGRVSRYLYARLPLVWPALKSYSRYRFECALRSSTVLGFIGLPTLGFHLETALKQGTYGQAAALLLLFFGLIATIRLWLRPALLPVYLLASLWWLPPQPDIDLSLALRFISQDIWPTPLLAGDLGGAFQWLLTLLHEQAIGATLNTLILAQIALAGALLVSLALFWTGSHHFVPSLLTPLGYALLLVCRSTPEILLAFVGLLLLGPSMLPAVLALALHNGGLLGYLALRDAQHLQLRVDASRGLDRYLYEVVPPLFPQLLGFLFYRWEVILRESAILGILGVTTLGFYIDSAFAEIRYDRAMLLILISALLNMLVDGLSRTLRQRAGIVGRVTAQ